MINEQSTSVTALKEINVKSIMCTRDIKLSHALQEINAKKAEHA